ncbi:MAG: GNAT family N-acetyltransferase [Thiobacillus sp.]|nr:GNAT family N-acetyltransferase [Thiobacillus sp.]
MSWQRIPLRQDLGAYRNDWDALNGRYYGGHPFLDSRFTESMLRHFGRGDEQLFVHRSMEAVDGLIILRERGAGVWRQFVPSQLQASPVLIPDTKLIDELFAALPLNAWIIELMNQDPNFVPSGLTAACPSRIVQAHALTVNVSLEGKFEAYWNGRSSNLAKNIRRYSNRVSDELGARELRVITDPDEMRESVKRFGELESSGWKKDIGTAVSIENVQGLFYAELMSRFAGSGQARVFEYWLGGRLAASRLIIEGAGMSVILKTAYDECRSRFAPGRLLLHDVLQQAFHEKRHKVVEFYTNASRDQLAWATGQRVISHVTCFRWPWLAALYKTFQRLKAATVGGTAEADNTDTPVVEVFDHISGLPRASKALFDSAERDSFDLGADWFELLQRAAIPKGENTRYYVLSRGGQVCCVLPLLVGAHHVSALTTFYTSIYRPMVARGVQPDELARLLRRVIKDTKACSLRFDAMDPSRPEYELVLAALQQTGLKAFPFFDFGNWHLLVSGRSFDEYFSKLSSKTRNTVKRREKRFMASGLGRIEIVTGGEGLEEAIQAWNRIYQSSWKVPEPYPEFMPGLIRLCARRGWLRLALAYFDGEPIAAQVWIVSHGRAAIYKLAYSESHAQYSAGTLLSAHLMRHVMDVDKVTEVDYLIGDDAYKKDWMSQRRERWGVVAYNLSSIRGLTGFGIQILGRIRHRMGRVQMRAFSWVQSKEAVEARDMHWNLFPVSEIGRLAPGWDDLNKRGPDSALLTSQFLQAALRAFGTGRERLACLGSPEAPDCMAILVERGRGVWETFQPAQAPIGFILMRAGLDLEAALNALILALPGIPLMVGITQQDPDVWPRPATSAKLQTLDYIDTARIVVEGDFDAFWEKRGKNLRQNMRKARNKLEKAGLTVSLVSITDPAAVKDAIANYGHMESAGWKARDGTAVHPENDQGRFYQDLLETHCQAGTGRIYQLMFNDTIAAMDLCVQRDDTIVILKTTYDEATAEYSPAMLMHQELFKTLFDSGVFQKIEFYGKVMDWHLRWTEDKRTMFHINYYRWKWLKRLRAPKLQFAKMVEAPAE